MLIENVIFVLIEKPNPLTSNILQAPLQAQILTQQVTEEEIKKALFSIREDKSPGPDGYSSFFFKKAWDIVGRDFVAAVLEFFSSGQILRQSGGL